MAGVSVTESSAAAAMAQVLVKARGLNSRPDWPSSMKMGRKETVTTSSEKKTLGPTSCMARRMTSARGALRPAASHSSSRRCTFSTRMIEASTMAPMAMAMPPSDMMLAVSCCCCIGMKASSDAHRNGEDRDQRAAQVEQEDHDHQRHHDHLLDEGAAERVDGAQDQLGAVVGDDELDAGGKARLHLLDARLHGVDHAERVLAEAHHHDAADGLALAVELREAALHGGAHHHLGDVLAPAPARRGR